MNVEKMIQILSNLNPKAEIVIRDEIRIMESTDGENAIHGIYDKFRVLEWHTLNQNGERVKGGEWVSFSFEDENRKNRLTASN